MRRPTTLMLLVGTILASGALSARGDTINQLAENIADFPASTQVVNSKRNSFGVVTQQMMILPTERPVLVFTANMDDGGVLAGYEYGVYTGSKLDLRYKEERLKALLLVQHPNTYTYFSRDRFSRRLRIAHMKNWLGNKKPFEFEVFFQQSEFDGREWRPFDWAEGKATGKPNFTHHRKWLCKVEVSSSYIVEDVACEGRDIHPADKADLVGWDILDDISFRTVMHPWREVLMRNVDIRLPKSVQDGRSFVDVRLPPGVNSFSGSPRDHFMSGKPVTGETADF